MRNALEVAFLFFLAFLLWLLRVDAEQIECWEE